MAELTNKANINTKEHPYFIKEGMWVRDMRTSTMRKISRIIFDPNHQPQFYVFLEVSKKDIDGNGRELAELDIPLEEVGCSMCDMAMGMQDLNEYMPPYFCRDSCAKAYEDQMWEPDCEYCGDSGQACGECGHTPGEDHCGHVECGSYCYENEEPELTAADLLSEDLADFRATCRDNLAGEVPPEQLQKMDEAQAKIDEARVQKMREKETK